MAGACRTTAAHRVAAYVVVMDHLRMAHHATGTRRAARVDR
jgi:hypothetical protein